MDEEMIVKVTTAAKVTLMDELAGEMKRWALI